MLLLSRQLIQIGEEGRSVINVGRHFDGSILDGLIVEVTISDDLFQPHRAAVSSPPSDQQACIFPDRGISGVVEALTGHDWYGATSQAGELELRGMLAVALSVTDLLIKPHSQR